MFTLNFHAAAVFLCAIGLTGAAVADQATIGVTVSPEIQRRLGVKTARLTVARHASEVDAFAKVLDPAPLVQLDSDLRTAVAVASASKAEADRTRALNSPAGGLAVKDVEAAVAQARADTLKVESLRRQVSLGWGPGVASLSEARRAELVRSLSTGAIALVHVDTHNNEGQAGARSVRIDVGDNSVTGRVIGPARVAEPRLQSSGLIVEVTGPAAITLAVGLIQSAHIATTTPQAGVVIPRGAVIRFNGSDWVYVRDTPGRFERRLMQDPVHGGDGLFVAHGFSNRDDVVVEGAASLFAAEQSRVTKPN